MKRSVLVAAAAALQIASAPALGQPSAIRAIQFTGGAVQTARINGESVVVFGDDNRPLFRSSPAFALDFAGNREARVYEWDTEWRRIRISGPGRPGAWVSCSDVVPMEVACSGRARVTPEGKLVLGERRATAGAVRNTGGAADSASVPEGAVPNCPADPRCPRITG